MTGTWVTADMPVSARAPPTQAISAVAEGPEPDFLRRRAVIVRHQGSPQGSGPGAEYRFLSASPDLSLLRRSSLEYLITLGYLIPALAYLTPMIADAPCDHRTRCSYDYVVLAVLILPNS